MSKYEVKLVNIGEEVDNRIRELEIEVKDIRKANDNLTRANESYRQENIEMRKENFGVEVAMLTKKVDDLKERNAFLEKLHSQHRYVFSEIPNTEENMKMVKLMKKHVNKDRYTVRWRGQYLIDGEDWKKYTDGQPMNKSKCIRVYIDSKGDDTTEGFKESEVDTILDSLDFRLRVGQDKGKDQTRELYKYFESMKIHLEESKLARAEVVNQNLSASE
jgi:FtsZ-binding cell division protein ZapB